MTKKDYIAVAAVVRQEYGSASDEERGVIEDIAGQLARVFAADNGRFDRGRFLRACGVLKEEVQR